MRVSFGTRYNEVLSRVQQMGQCWASQLPCPKAKAEYSFLGPLQGPTVESNSQNSLGEAGICNLNVITHPHCSVSMALGRRRAVRLCTGTFDSPWSFLLGLEP